MQSYGPQQAQSQFQTGQNGIHPYYVYDSYNQLQQKIVQQAWTLGILMFVLFIIVGWMFVLLKKWFHRYCDKPKNGTTSTTESRPRRRPERRGPYYRYDEPMRRY